MFRAINKKSLKAIFNEEATLAQKHFPRRVKNLFICDTKRPIYISKGVANILTKATGCAKNAIKKHYRIKELIAEYRDEVRSFEARALVRQKHFFLLGFIKPIIFDDSVSFETDSKFYNKKIKTVDDVLHEMGHLLVKNGHKGGSLKKLHIGECAADAYRALRHFQLFGINTGFADHNNSSHVVIERYSPIHLTGAVVQKIEALSKEVDLSKLSYKGTVKLAGKIAVKYSFDGRTLSKITEAYSHLVGEYKVDKNTSKIAKKCFKTMMKNTKDHNVYRVGKLYLNKYEVKKNINQNDSFWVKANKQMTDFERISEIELDFGKVYDVKLGSKAITAGMIEKKTSNKCLFKSLRM